MKTYDCECPGCKAMNRNLFLNDADGWFECINCGTVSRPVDFRYHCKMPVYDLSQLRSIMKNELQTINEI